MVTRSDILEYIDAERREGRRVASNGVRVCKTTRIYTMEMYAALCRRDAVGRVSTADRDRIEDVLADLVRQGTVRRIHGGYELTD